MGVVLTDSEIEKNLKDSEKRIKSEFIFLPMTIKGVTKSFQKVKYMEIKVHKTFYGPINGATTTKEVWEKFKWIEE